MCFRSKGSSLALNPPRRDNPESGTQTALGALAARDAADLARAPFDAPGVAGKLLAGVSEAIGRAAEACRAGMHPSLSASGF
jgi:hypothetical protein